MCHLFGYACRIYLIAAWVFAQTIVHLAIVIICYQIFWCSILPKPTQVVPMFAYMAYFYKSECMNLTQVGFPPNWTSPPSHYFMWLYSRNKNPEKKYGRSARGEKYHGWNLPMKPPNNPNLMPNYQKSRVRRANAKERPIGSNGHWQTSSLKDIILDERLLALNSNDVWREPNLNDISILDYINTSLRRKDTDSQTVPLKVNWPPLISTTSDTELLKLDSHNYRHRNHSDQIDVESWTNRVKLKTPDYKESVLLGYHKPRLRRADYAQPPTAEPYRFLLPTKFPEFISTKWLIPTKPWWWHNPAKPFFPKWPKWLPWPSWMPWPNWLTASNVQATEIKWPHRAKAVKTTYRWIIAYLVMDPAWLLTTCLLILGALIRIRGLLSMFFYIPWMLVTICILIMDLVSTGYYATTIAYCTTWYDYLNFMGVENMEEVRDTTKIWFADYKNQYTYPSIIATLFCSRFVLLWIFNLLTLLTIIHIFRRVVHQKVVSKKVVVKQAPCAPASTSTVAMGERTPPCPTLPCSAPPTPPCEPAPQMAVATCPGQQKGFLDYLLECC